jgi:hypothetical protein
LANGLVSPRGNARNNSFQQLVVGNGVCSAGAKSLAQPLAMSGAMIDFRCRFEKARLRSLAFLA